MATLIGNPKLVERAKSLRKKLVNGKKMSYGQIAKAMHLRDNKAAWVLVNDTPGMDRTPKGTRGAKVKKTAKAVKRITAKKAAKRQTRRAA